MQCISIPLTADNKQCVTDMRCDVNTEYRKYNHSGAKTGTKVERTAIANNHVSFPGKIKILLATMEIECIAFI